MNANLPVEINTSHVKNVNPFKLIPGKNHLACTYLQDTYQIHKKMNIFLVRNMQDEKFSLSLPLQLLDNFKSSYIYADESFNISCYVYIYIGLDALNYHY